MIKHIFKLIWNKKRSNALIMLEIFLSFAVLFVVMSYVLFNLDTIEKPLGFSTEDRWVIQLDNQVYLKDSADRVMAMEQLRAELIAMAEIEQVTFLDNIAHFSDNNWRNTFHSDGGHSINADLMPADLDYQDVMDVEIIEGRWFEEGDLASPHIKIIVNSSWMRDYPDASVIDSVYTMGDETYQVVGAVHQNRYRGEFAEEETTVLLLRPFYENIDNIVLKMKADTPMEIEEDISNLVNNVTKTTGSTISTLEKRRVENSRHSWVLMIALLSICGFLCINVALGLFGVLSYTISKRRGEIGLRQAIGAHSTNITLQFILEILVLTSLAVGLGIFFAIQIPLLDVTGYPDSLFYRAIVYATLIMIALVLLCALLPSLQAANIRPATALHED